MSLLKMDKVTKKSFDVMGDNLLTVSIDNIIAGNSDEAKFEYINIIDTITTYNTQFTAILPDGRIVTLRIDHVETEDVSVFENGEE